MNGIAVSLRSSENQCCLSQHFLHFQNRRRIIRLLRNYYAYLFKHCRKQAIELTVCFYFKSNHFFSHHTEYVTSCLPANIEGSTSTGDNGKRGRLRGGRPCKSFEECSVKMKRDTLNYLLSDYTAEKLQFASKCLSVTEALTLTLDLDLQERKSNVVRTVGKMETHFVYLNLLTLQTYQRI